VHQDIQLNIWTYYLKKLLSAFCGHYSLNGTSTGLNTTQGLNTQPEITSDHVPPLGILLNPRSILDRTQFIISSHHTTWKTNDAFLFHMVC